jgi:hypothetical protein
MPMMIDLILSHGRRQVAIPNGVTHEACRDGTQARAA